MPPGGRRGKGIHRIRDRMEIGNWNELKIARDAGFGVYLTDGENDVLLPAKEVPEGAKTGDVLRVFCYLDSEDRPVATTAAPKVVRGDCAVLRVKEVTKVGAFLDWGLPKDLLLPFAEQTRKVSTGDEVYITPYIDKSGRICASMYASRRPDGMKADPTVRKKAYRQMAPDGEKVLRIITEEYGGVLPFDDKASPEQIKKVFALSKASFKRAVGGLYKERKILLGDGRIRVLPE